MCTFFSVVTWRHGYKKRIAVRQVAGRAEKGLTTPTTSSASSTRHHHSAQELQHMCSIHALPSQPLPLCGCGNVGCLECTSAQPRVVVICGQLSSASCCNLSVPVVSNSAYQVESPSGHEVALKTNLAYTLPQNQAPPLAPPPPPYPGTSKVESVHEYDYITARN